MFTSFKMYEEADWVGINYFRASGNQTTTSDGWHWRMRKDSRNHTTNVVQNIFDKNFTSHHRREFGYRIEKKIGAIDVSSKSLVVRKQFRSVISSPLFTAQQTWKLLLLAMRCHSCLNELLVWFNFSSFRACHQTRVHIISCEYTLSYGSINNFFMNERLPMLDARADDTSISCVLDVSE